jgi:hypothetical protein
MACEFVRKRKKRRYLSTTTLPLKHRGISKKRYRSLLFDRVYRFYSLAHGIDLENHNFRKVIYDAVYDALENKNGKIHRRDYFNEIQKFYDKYYSTVPPSEQAKLSDWNRYRSSTQYQEFLNYVKGLDKLEHRVDVTISNALSYLNARHQNRNLIYEAVETVEQKLGLNYIPELWSKGSLWFITNVLFFHQISFMFKVWKFPVVIDVTKFVAKDLEDEIDIELKHTKDWFDSKFYYDLSNDEKLFFNIYNHVIAPSVGETGSVILADLLRAGTSWAMHWGARALWVLARFHPGLRVLGAGAYLFEGLAQVLDRSILAWLGWQIAVEWSLDGWIQMTTNRLGETLYRHLNGEDWKKAWKFSLLSPRERYQLVQQYFGLYRDIIENIVNYYRSDKPVQLRNMIERKIKEFSDLGIDLGVQERTTKLLNKIRNILKLFEAKYQLHQLYQNAKAEYGHLKNFLRMDMEDYVQKSKVYCQTNTEKDRISASLALCELLNDSMKFKVQLSLIQCLGKLFHACDPTSAVYIAQLLHHLQKNSYSYLDDVYYEFIDICSDKKKLLEFQYGNGFYKKLYDEGLDLHVTLNCYFSVDSKPVTYTECEDFSDLIFSYEECPIMIRFGLLWWVYAFIRCGRTKQYFYFEHDNNQKMFIPDKILLINPAIKDILKDPETLNTLVFGYLNLYRDAYYLLHALSDEYCFSKNVINYVPATIARSGLLRYSLRNRCFSVQNAKQTIKRLIHADVVEEIYNRMKQAETTKMFHNVFISGFTDHYALYTVYEDPPGSGEFHREEITSYKKSVLSMDKYITLEPIDNVSFKLKFALNIHHPKEDECKKYEHDMKIYLLPKTACKPVQKPLKKSKRSKIICFI